MYDNGYHRADIISPKGPQAESDRRRPPVAQGRGPGGIFLRLSLGNTVCDASPARTPRWGTGGGGRRDHHSDSKAHTTSSNLTHHLPHSPPSFSTPHFRVVTGAWVGAKYVGSDGDFHWPDMFVFRLVVPPRASGPPPQVLKLLVLRVAPDGEEVAQGGGRQG